MQREPSVASREASAALRCLLPQCTNKNLSSIHEKASQVVHGPSLYLAPPLLD